MRPYFENSELVLYCGDAAEVLPQLEASAIQAALTSPPYWGLRDYGADQQVGQEASPQAYVARLTECLAGLRPLLAADGTFWLNLGDSYITNPGNGRGGERVEGGKPHRSSRDKTKGNLGAKNLAGVPWRAALALQEAGWTLRADVIWEKPNVKPDGAKDRPTVSHEYLFLFSKEQRYYYDRAALAEPARGGGTRNGRTVWRIPTAPFPGTHFACWPPVLAERLIKASTRQGDIVLDPFFGAGTTALVARALGRRTIGIEIKRDYCDLALRRLGCRS